MSRDIEPLTRSLEDATPGEQSDIYGLLAAWDQSIENALDRGDGSRFRVVMGQYLEDVISPGNSQLTLISNSGFTPT